MNTTTELQNLSTGRSPYGYPVAHFDPTILPAWGRLVEATDIYWDAELGHYVAVGFYVKKDGTAGLQRAKAIMPHHEVPQCVSEALDPIR